MNKSESIKNLAIALSKFQGEIKNPGNTAVNPFFKSKYAPLEIVLNSVRPILSKHGLSVIQAPSTDENTIVITTILIHESGEFIETEPLKLKMDKVTAQGAGSSITYARRYALSSILGIASEDDNDGNDIEKSNEPELVTTKKTNKPKLATENELTILYGMVKEKDYNNSIVGYIKTMYGKDNSKELTSKEVEEIIKMLKGK